jgi:hypothetical protein
MHWINVAQDRDRCQALMRTVKKTLGLHKSLKISCLAVWLLESGDTIYSTKTVSWKYELWLFLLKQNKRWTPAFKYTNCQRSNKIAKIKKANERIGIPTKLAKNRTENAYCNVLGFYSRRNFIALQKVNTLQLNTASNSSNTRRRPTRTVSEHSLL